MDAGVQAKGGYPKFSGSCALAKKLGYDLIWIDTCCINKTDSVELGEAINSMYRWYAKSNVCIVFLEDVSYSAQIGNSVWFERGWTLQELIASRTVRFYDTKWAYLGDKTSLSGILLRKTLIPEDVLKNKRQPQACSIAQRMSWAAKRTTGRVEDRAYSLMGLFDVNMPMVYGEREQAFIRLQHQIISKSTDESIFAWDLDLLDDGQTRDAKEVHCGLLASSPACFARCGDVISLGSSRGFHLNQFGLSISLASTPYGLGMLQAPLKVGKVKAAGQYAVFLIKLPGDDSYARVSSPSGESFILTKSIGRNFTRVSVPPEITQPPVRVYAGFWLRKLGFYDSRILRNTCIERGDGREADRMNLPENEIGTAGIVSISFHDDEREKRVGWIKLGLNSSSQPMCCVILPVPGEDGKESSEFMSKQLDGLQRTASGSDGRRKHAAFDSNWMRRQGGAAVLPGVSSRSYESRSATGSFDDGFELTYEGAGFDMTISAHRVPDMKRTRMNKPVEIWAIDIVCGTPPPAATYSHGCCC